MLLNPESQRSKVKMSTGSQCSDSGHHRCTMEVGSPSRAVVCVCWHGQGKERSGKTIYRYTRAALSIGECKVSEVCGHRKQQSS